MEGGDTSSDEIDAKSDDSRHFNSSRWFSIAFAEMQIADRKFSSFDKNGLKSAIGRNVVTHEVCLGPSGQTPNINIPTMFPPRCCPSSFSVYPIPQFRVQFLSNISPRNLWQRYTLRTLLCYPGFTLIPSLQDLTGRCCSNDTRMRATLE